MLVRRRPEFAAASLVVYNFPLQRKPGMTTQTLSPFPSAFPASPPLAHARLSADGAENLPLWTAPSLWRALPPLRRNAFVSAVGATGIGGPGANAAAFPCGDFPDGANLPLFAVAIGPGGLLMMDDGAGRMQGGNETISLTNALEWAALLCAWTLRETAKVLPMAAPAAEQEESGAAKIRYLDSCGELTTAVLVVDEETGYRFRVRDFLPCADAELLAALRTKAKELGFDSPLWEDPTFPPPGAADAANAPKFAPKE